MAAGLPMRAVSRCHQLPIPSGWNLHLIDRPAIEEKHGLVVKCGHDIRPLYRCSRPALIGEKARLGKGSDAKTGHGPPLGKLKDTPEKQPRRSPRGCSWTTKCWKTAKATDENAAAPRLTTRYLRPGFAKRSSVSVATSSGQRRRGFKSSDTSARCCSGAAAGAEYAAGRSAAAR